MADYGHTLILSDTDWDLTLTESGGIATATGAYAVSQNVANAVRLFTQDAFYDPDRGIPHFVTDLGRRFSPPVVRSEVQAAALSVAGVKRCRLTDARVTRGTEVAQTGDTVRARTLTGDIRLTLETGETANVTL